MGEMDRLYCMLYVRDQEAGKEFFESVLGHGPALHVPGMTEFEVKPGVFIGLIPEDDVAGMYSLEHAELSHGSIRGEIYMVVAAPELHHRRALAAGAQELSALAPRSWGDEVAYSLDPNGYVLAFARTILAGS